MNVESLMREVRARIDAAAISNEPYPHLHVTGCFPDAYYDQMLAHWPQVDEFVSSNEGAVLAINFARRGDQPLTGQMGPERVRTHAFWMGFKDVVEDAVIPAIVCKLAPSIRALMRRRLLRRRPRLTGADFLILNDMLITRRNKHELSPHLDSQRSLIQLLLYLPPDDDHPHLGTQLFEQVGAGTPLAPAKMANPTEVQYSHGLGIEVREAKRIPFLRNTLVAAINYARSWHGQYLDEPYDRHGYQAFIGPRAPLLEHFYDTESAAALRPYG